MQIDWKCLASWLWFALVIVTVVNSSSSAGESPSSPSSAPRKVVNDHPPRTASLEGSSSLLPENAQYVKSFSEELRLLREQLQEETRDRLQRFKQKMVSSGIIKGLDIEAEHENYEPDTNLKRDGTEVSDGEFETGESQSGQGIPIDLFANPDQHRGGGNRHVVDFVVGDTDEEPDNVLTKLGSEPVVPSLSIPSQTQETTNKYEYVPTGTPPQQETVAPTRQEAVDVSEVRSQKPKLKIRRKNPSMTKKNAKKSKKSTVPKVKPATASSSTPKKKVSKKKVAVDPFLGSTLKKPRKAKNKKLANLKTPVVDKDTSDQKAIEPLLDSVLKKSKPARSEAVSDDLSASTSTEVANDENDENLITQSEWWKALLTGLTTLLICWLTSVALKELKKSIATEAAILATRGQR